MPPESTETPPATTSQVIPEINISAERPLVRLRQQEIESLIGNVSDELRRCALGILHTGQSTDDTEKLLRDYPNFDIEIQRGERQGLSFRLKNAPTSCFTMRDGNIACQKNVQEHLTAAVRDLEFATDHIGENHTPGKESTDAIFFILRNAGFFHTSMSRAGQELDRRRLFAWGGHSINNDEYMYTKAVGRELALQFFELITGGGPGVMRGTLSGALAGYKTERIEGAKQFGFSCPSIITSEPPNNIIDPLIILPDIEKRLEAFIRGSLGGVVFPGGAGTAEEILTMITILLHPKNNDSLCPMIFAAPNESSSYFEDIDKFLNIVFGSDLNDRNHPMYEIMTDDPRGVASKMAERCDHVASLRSAFDEEIDWNGRLFAPEDIQKTFYPTHEEMAKLAIYHDQKPHVLAAELRKLFSGIVYGNVTDEGIKMIREHGPFEIYGEKDIIDALDTLLQRFISEGRMKLEGDYDPCYILKTS